MKLNILRQTPGHSSSPTAAQTHWECFLSHPTLQGRGKGLVCQYGEAFSMQEEVSQESQVTLSSGVGKPAFLGRLQSLFQVRHRWGPSKASI